MSLATQHFCTAQKDNNFSLFAAIVVFHHLARFASQFADRFTSRESYLHVECHWKHYEATVMANGGQGTGNGKWKTGNVERGTEKGEPEPGTESTSAEIGSSKRWEVRTLQLSHVVFSVTSNPFFILVLILCFFSVSFSSLFHYLFNIFCKVCYVFWSALEKWIPEFTCALQDIWILSFIITENVWSYRVLN